MIVNEFGEIGIDGELIESGDEELIELSSGCICCVVRGDLIRTLRALLRRRADLDGIADRDHGPRQSRPGDPDLPGRPGPGGASAGWIRSRRWSMRSHSAAGSPTAPTPPTRSRLADQIVLNKVGDAPDARRCRIEAAASAQSVRADPARRPRRGGRGATCSTASGFDLDRIAARMPETPPTTHDHDHVAADGIASLALSCRPAPRRRRRWSNGSATLLAVAGRTSCARKG